MKAREQEVRVLYVVYWGALEPLGQSLVTPTVLRLAGIGVRITLITFEKAQDLERSTEMTATKQRYDDAGIEWHPLRYHKTPKWPGTMLDALQAICKALVLSLRDKFDVVHGRTFVAGPMAVVAACLLRAPFVYHNEGFYPDEQVDAGVWKADSSVHRFAKRLEEFLYQKAAGIIVLSHRAQAVVEALPGVAKRQTPIVVVPSAVDLVKFRSRKSGEHGRGSLSLVYLGSVGLRYRLDEAGRFVAAVRKLRPDTTLTVISRAAPALVQSMLDASGLDRSAWALTPLPHADVPAELVKHDAGLLFWPRGLSEHGCSPTKIGEYWASGLPVVTTPNVSDTDAIVRSERVGVVVDPDREGDLDAGAKALLNLLSDPDLLSRCRDAAEAAYSLEVACERQLALYRRLCA